MTGDPGAGTGAGGGSRGAGEGAAGTRPERRGPGDGTSGAGLADLLAVLDAQAGVYGHLHQLADARHAALVAADVERLGDLVEQEQPLLSRVHRLELARLQVIRPFAERLNVAPEDVSVTALAEALGPPAADQLFAVRERLLGAVAALDEVNVRNARLLESCLSSAEESIQHLLETVKVDPRYASSGRRAAHEEGPRLTDFRA